MVDSIMYQEDGYVVLESNHPEQLMTEAELLAKLVNLLQETEDLSADIRKYATATEQARYVLENYCEFSADDDRDLQWYVVRWEKR